MGKINVRHHGSGHHGVTLGQFHPRLVTGCKRAEAVKLGCVVAAAGIAEHRADKLVLFGDHIVAAQAFIAGMTPAVLRIGNSNTIFTVSPAFQS